LCCFRVAVDSAMKILRLPLQLRGLRAGAEIFYGRISQHACHT
jgi:hypothetical protein